MTKQLQPYVGRDSPEALHLFADVQRVAVADRDACLAHLAFVDAPIVPLLDPDCVRARIVLEHELLTVRTGETRLAKWRVGRASRRGFGPQRQRLERFLE